MPIVQALLDEYDHFMTELADQRINDYFLMSSLTPTVILCVVYLGVAIVLLPMYMKKRPAFNTDKAIYYYNIFQVILSAVTVYMNMSSGWIRRFSIFECRDIDRSSTDPDATMAMNGVYLFYLAKFTEFPDTIFFLLRKKYNQVSFLHLYHHASMPVNTWLMAKLVPGGTSTLGAGINASIHVIMYSYYLMAGLGPQWQKYLWWKKYLTAFQLAQFAFGVYHMFMVLFGNCTTLQTYHPLFTYYLFYITSLLLLFAKFYNDSYNKKPRTRTGTKSEETRPKQRTNKLIK